MTCSHFRSNRTQYANVSLRNIPDDYEAELLDLPSLAGMDEDDDTDVTDEEEELEKEMNTVEQLSDQMITLSMEPRAKWQTLLNLDTIKVCFFKKDL